MKKLKYYLIISLCVYGLVNIKLGKSHAYTINLTQISVDSYVSISISSLATGTHFSEDSGAQGAGTSVSGTYTYPDGSSDDFSLYCGIEQDYGVSTPIIDINGNIYSSANIDMDYFGMHPELILPGMLINGSAYTYGSYILNIVSDYGNTGNVDVTVSGRGSGGDNFWPDYFIISGPGLLHYLMSPIISPFDITLELGLDYMVSANLDSGSNFFVEDFVSRNIRFDVMEPIPLPSTILLLCTGIIGLFGIKKKLRS